MLIDYFILMNAPPRTPYHEVLDSVTAQARMAEQTGANTFWLSEHHFGGEGFDIQPNPIMTAMHLSRYVSQIRLGIAALILTEWHPLRLAEDVAIWDQSLKGRIEVGIAKGITNREISNLNPFEVDRRFPEANNAMFLETLDIMKKAWTEDPFTYDGRFYKFPKAGVPDSYRAWIPRLKSGTGAPSEEYQEMSIVPKPYQQPHPPLWVVGDTDNTFATAAQNGCKAITWLRSWEALRVIFETYRDTASEVRGRQLALGEDAALMRVCYVAPTREKAREIAEPGVEYLFRDIIGGARSRGIYAEPGEVISEEEAARPWFDFLDDRGHLLIGTPNDVIEKIKKTQEWIGLERLLLFTWLPDMSLPDVLSSMELFGKEVLPCLGP
jgi:alkanesulfonate monooxygenase SsuD/methylene tetrahydromethanopterin reductase-like flavin-dependent oxidoreductase (luciferase family)